MIKPKKKRICRFCENKVIYVDYKDPKRLMKFTTEVAKLFPDAHPVPVLIIKGN